MYDFAELAQIQSDDVIRKCSYCLMHVIIGLHH